MGAATLVGQPLHAAILVTIKDLVPGLAGYAKLPAKICHWLRRAMNCSLSSMTEHSFQGIHFLPKKGASVTPCVRYVLTYVPGRSLITCEISTAQHLCRSLCCNPRFCPP